MKKAVFITHPELLEAAKKEHLRRLDHKPYVSPIPRDVVPTVIGMKN